MPDSNATGKKAADMRADHQAWALCPWTYEGTAHEGRELAKGHRRVHHPELKPTRRRRGHLTRYLANDDGWQAEGAAKAAQVVTMLARRSREEAA